MSIQYYRTEKGRQALIDRSIRLNARQRALLLMIESEEANTLLRNQIEKLATPENLAQLVEHGLIESMGDVLPEQDLLTHLAIPAAANNEAEFINAPIAALVEQPVTAPEPVVVASTLDDAYAGDAGADAAVVQPPVLTARVEVLKPVVGPLFDAVEVPDTVLSLDEVKMMMVASLRRYCGLLAAPLVRDIEKAVTAGQLRMCQMRWVTLLTESRAGAHNIAMWKEQINENLKNLA